MPDITTEDAARRQREEQASELGAAADKAFDAADLLDGWWLDLPAEQRAALGVFVYDLRAFADEARDAADALEEGE